PKPAPPGPKPAGKPGQVAPGTPLAGAPLGYVMSPEDLIVDGEGRPQRIDKAFSWEAPIAAHGLMHMLIRNAANRDPYPIDTLFMYMANMAWNSAMNTTETMRLLTDKDPATGGYKDYIALHERSPGIGPLAGWRGADGDAHGKGAPNAKQLDRYIANGCFWKYELPPEQLYFKHANKAYLEGATAMGLIPAPEP